MDKLSHSEVMAILDGSEYPYISISRDGVFIDRMNMEPNSPEYSQIRRMETNHPQKDITKPLFTFPCTVNELRDFLHDNDDSCLLSGVIYIDKGKKYTASEVIDLMVEATLLETSLLPDDEKMGVSSQQYKKQFLDDHQLLKNDYQESMTEYLKRHLITVLGDETEQKLKDISLENIMDDLINWLQGERFAVFVINSDADVQQKKIRNGSKKVINQSVVKRTDPVREIMITIFNNHPNIKKSEMWAKIQDMATNKNPPFVYMEDNHTVFYVTGGNAKEDQKELKLMDFNKRFDRLTPLVSANNC